LKNIFTKNTYFKGLNHYKQKNAIYFFLEYCSVLHVIYMVIRRIARD